MTGQIKALLRITRDFRIRELDVEIKRSLKINFEAQESWVHGEERRIASVPPLIVVLWSLLPLIKD